MVQSIVATFFCHDGMQVIYDMSGKLELIANCDFKNFDYLVD